jgi:transposase
MEIIIGADRRRRWRLEEKLRIVAETEQPGASFATVARRHEISRGLLWNWRQQVRRGALTAEPMPMFVPVQITPDPPLMLPSPSPAQATSPAEDARVEITLPDGTCVRVGTGVGLANLRRIMSAVRR